MYSTMGTRSLIYVDIAISQDEYLLWYQGAANQVFARALDGRTVNFPASILQKFVTREGVRGRFAIEFDASNKFKSISRVV